MPPPSLADAMAAQQQMTPLQIGPQLPVGIGAVPQMQPNAGGGVSNELNLSSSMFKPEHITESDTQTIERIREENRQRFLRDQKDLERKGMSPQDAAAEVSKQRMAGQLDVHGSPTVDPGTLAFAPAKPAAGEGGGFDPAMLRHLMASRGGGAGTVAATNVPLMDPTKIAEEQQLQQGVLARQGDVATAEQHVAKEAGVNAGLKAQKLREQGEETRKQAEEHDKSIQDVQSKIEQASRDAADQTIDVERGWKNTSTFDKARYTVASILGGFLNGYTGGRVANVGLQKINEIIGRDLEAQKQEIEAKKGRVADMRGILADTFRRFGNMDQAMEAAHALAIQQLDSEALEHAAASNSEKRMADAQLLSSQMQLQAKQHVDSLFKYVPAHAAGGGGPDLSKEYGEYARDLLKNGEKNILSFPEWAKVRLGAGGAAATPKGEGGTPDDRFKKYQDATLAKSETPLSRAEWEKRTSGNQSTGPGAGLPAVESTAWSPQHLLPGGPIQGTDVAAKENVQARYNAAVTKAVIDKYGRGAERNEKLVESLLQAYKVEPGDTQGTIDRKRAAAAADLGMSGGASGGGGVKYTPVDE